MTNQKTSISARKAQKQVGEQSDFVKLSFFLLKGSYTENSGWCPYKPTSKNRYSFKKVYLYVAAF